MITQDTYPIILGGGSSLLKGLIPFCKEYINKSTQNHIKTPVNVIIDNVTYSTAVGTILYGINTNAIRYIPIKKNLFNFIKKWQ